MHNAITSEIVVAYSLCPQKAFLLLCTEEKGTLHEYEQILQKQKLATQNQFLTTLSQTNLDIHFYTPTALTSAFDVLVNATLATEGLEAVCCMLTKVVQPSSLGEYSYGPAIVVGTHSITKEQKLELLFTGYILGKIQRKVPEHGNIIDVDGFSHQVKIGESANILLPLLRPLQTWATVSSPEPPTLLLNKHCPSCQFQAHCLARAEKEDNLSLLAAIKPKDVQHFRKKGIFTVKQL
jgi:predicted RecB family nuclease